MFCFARFFVGESLPGGRLFDQTFFELESALTKRFTTIKPQITPIGVSELNQIAKCSVRVSPRVVYRSKVIENVLFEFYNKQVSVSFSWSASVLNKKKTSSNRHLQVRTPQK